MSRNAPNAATASSLNAPAATVTSQPAGATTGATGAVPGTAASGTTTTPGLEVLGIPGGSYLREALTSCSDPLQAIEEFQVENGILLPSLRPMMPLLDLHGVKRLDFHINVMEVQYSTENKAIML